jgi:hypothetical protein
MNNSPDNPKLFDFEISPYQQCLYALGAIPVFTIIFYIPHWIGFVELGDHQPWTVAASMVLMFAVTNSVLSLGADDINKYWNKSIYSYIALVVIGGLMAWLFSGLSLYEAKSFKWIYIVFTFGYLAFLSIVTFMRKIVIIAQREDKRLRGESDD